MNPVCEDYSAFLERLKGYERLEPFPRSRGPEKLSGVKRIARTLGHPEESFRVVHVAGTNGKGMTSAMIARLLTAAGRTAGLYTSPHVSDIRERIVLDGGKISEALFARCGHQVLDLADDTAGSIHFSYFDLLTLIAMAAFREAGVEWAVLETGLGGLSDATNITAKELCVLTRIGMDHLHVLGNTLEEIALQKLGIVPEGVPTVLAGQPEGLGDWMRGHLAARNNPVLDASAIRLEFTPGNAVPLQASWPDGTSFAIQPPEMGGRVTRPKLACAAAALAAAEQLLGGKEGALRAGRLRTALETSLPGRLEIRHGQRPAGHRGEPLETLVLDGGHNSEAVQALTAELKQWGISSYALLISLQKDKLVEPLRAPLRDLLAGARRLLILAPQTSRAPASGELEAFLRDLLPNGRRKMRVETVADAHAGLLALAESPREPAVITGSFWMLGDVIRDLEAGRTPSRGSAGATG